MILKYAVTKEDYIEYYTYVSWDAPEQKRKKINYYLRQLLINGGVIAIIFYSRAFSFHFWYMYIYLGILLLTIIFQIFSARNSVSKQAEKVTLDENNASIFSEKIMEIDDSGISLKDAVTESRFRWQAFIKKQENNHYYFLFTSSIEAIIIPKRIFKLADEKSRFEKLLTQHLSLDAEVGHLVKD
jgi:YcxB-like protein